IPFRNAQSEAGNLHRCGQKIAIIGNDPERNHLGQVIGIGEEKLIETRWAAVQHPEPIAALAYLHEWLRFPIDELHIADQSIVFESIETDQPGTGIDELVRQKQWNVKLREAGKVEPGAFVASVKLVENKLEAGQPFVRVLRSVVKAVVVIPQSAQGFIDVAIGRIGGVKAGLLQGVVIIEILAAKEIAAGAAIAFRAGMEIVQMCGNFRYPEPTTLVLRGQFIEAANHDWLLITGHNRGPGSYSDVTRIGATLVEPPDGLRGNISIGGDAEIRVCAHPLDEIVLRRVLVEELEAVRSWPQSAVELTSALERKLVCRIDGVIGELLRSRT